ncbi:septum formation initiator family protein [Candidatus Uhrbacteria bacterium]|nr:septum formation initiator family protein [Candidatus Uhrbacteria bacterium]
MTSPFLQRLIRWRLLIVVNLLVILFLALTLGRELVRSRSIDAQIAALQAQADELSASTQEMLDLQTAMQTESFIEREARLKLGLKKPGETVVVIQEGTEEPVSDSGDAADPLGLVIDEGEAPVNLRAARLPNPFKWWYYFFDKSLYLSLLDYE